MTPLISVVLPVHNGESYIREAVESVLGQTFKNFEFFVYNDRSTDSTLEILQSFNDERLIVEDNQTVNNHLALRNEGFQRAKGRYVAIMDGDDVCAPTRFERQLAFLDAHPEVGVCGSFAHKIGLEEGLWELGQTNDVIKFVMLRSCEFIHPSVMIRRDVLIERGVAYDLSHQSGGADYKLWVDLYDKTEFYNIPEPLLFYRFHDSNMSVGNDSEKLKRYEAISLKAKSALYQKVFPELSEDEKALVRVLLSRDLRGVKDWDSLRVLYSHLRTTAILHVDKERLFKELDKQIFRFAFQNTNQGYKNYRSYRALGKLWKRKSFARELDLIYKSIFSIPKRSG
ncbi:MAG: glycosyltransferase family 2 protein [Planctomycetota bacterium]|nr:glycosyltransferase family 2 protein [Planctomycetota bacterium]